MGTEEKYEDNLKEKCQKLRRDVQDRNMDIKSLQEENEDLQFQLKTRRRGKMQSCDVINELQNRVDQLRKDKRKIEKSMTSLSRENSSLEAQVYEVRNERDLGNRNLRNLSLDSTRAKNKISELERENERIKKESARTLRQIEAQVGDLEQQISSGDKKFSKLHEKNSQIEKELNDLKFQKAAAFSPKGSLNGGGGGGNQQKSVMREATRKTIEQLELFKLEAENEINLLKNEIETKSNSLRSCDRTNMQLQEELRKMDSELELEFKDRDVMMTEKAQLSRDFHALENRMAEVQCQKENLDKEVQRLTETSKEQSDHRAELESNLKASVKRSEDLMRDLEELELEFGKEKKKSKKKDFKDFEISQLEKKVGKIKKELEAAQLNEKAAGEKLVSASSSLEAAESKLRDSSEKNEELLKDLRDKEELLREKSGELEATTTKMNDLNDWLAEMERNQIANEKQRKQLNNLTLANDVTTRGLQEKVEEFEELKTTVVQYQQKAAADEKECERLRALVAEVSKERDDVVSGRNGKNQEDNDVIQKLKKKLLEVIREGGELKRKLKVAETAAASGGKAEMKLKQNLNEKSREVEDAYKRIKKLREEIVRVQDMKGRDQDAKKTKEMTEALEKLRGTLLAKEESAKTNDANVKRLTDSVRAKEREISAFVNEIDTIKKLLGEDDDICEQIQQLHGNVERSSLKRSEVEEELRSCQQELKVLDDEFAQLEEKHNSLKSQAKRDVAEEIGHLRAELSNKDEIITAAEDSIKRQKHVIEDLTRIQQHSSESSIHEMEQYMRESDQQFEQLKLHLGERDQTIKELTGERDELRVQLEETDKDEPKRVNNSDGDDDEARDKFRNEIDYLSSRVLDVEDEKDELKKQSEILKDQLEELKDEIIVERDRNDEMKSENNSINEKLEVSAQNEEDLKSKVVYLEEKLQHQMGPNLTTLCRELNAIESNHQKTKVKLREIIQQAESDISKANNEKEMVSEKLSSLEEKLFDAEQKLASSANDQKCLHAQMRQIKDENAQLRKSLNLNSSNNNNNNNNNNSNKQRNKQQQQRGKQKQQLFTSI